MLAFSITACGTKGDTAKTASAENNSTNAESTDNKKEVTIQNLDKFVLFYFV